ncbi:Bardet-Biedl syndrome 2 protein homolog [Anopheles merus]|uniref:Bardet-Biedl syndrome 2 protein homolog n=2 Tax=Anopheles merus TaxID=30066 RepID=UPI001BE3E506|nr:Bardet-Biedl syndrome 2 protein homolog [Anopheles merus]
MDISTKPVFSFSLNYKVFEKLVTCGKYDGIHSCLTMVTTADKILIHTPHKRYGLQNSKLSISEIKNDIALLNMNFPIRAIVAGRLKKDDERDVLVIGSPSHVLAYHVDENCNMFQRDFHEGVRSAVIGGYANQPGNTLIVGGNGTYMGRSKHLFYTRISLLIATGLPRYAFLRNHKQNYRSSGYGCAGQKSPKYSKANNSIYFNMLTLHNVADEEMNALLTQKQKLLLELKHYENNIKYNKEILSNTSESNLVQSVPDNVGIIPSNTRLQIGISTSYDSNDMNIDITVSTNNSTTIRGVLIFADQLFKEESLIAHLTKDVSRILIPLKTLKDNAQDIHIKAFVGYPSSVQFHVFELTRQLPKFAMYTIPHNLTGSPKSVYEVKII